MAIKLWMWLQLSSQVYSTLRLVGGHTNHCSPTSTTHTSKYGIFLTLTPISRPRDGYLQTDGDITTTPCIFVYSQSFKQSVKLPDAHTVVTKKV